MGKQYADKIPRIHEILAGSIPSTHLQLGLNSDLANILAWRALLGEDATSLALAPSQMTEAIKIKGQAPSDFAREQWDTTFDLAAKAPKFEAKSKQPSGSEPSSSKDTVKPVSTEEQTSTDIRAPVTTQTTDTQQQQTTTQTTQPPTTTTHSDTVTTQVVNIHGAQSRPQLIQLGTMGLNQLRDQWRHANGSDGNPPQYGVRLENMQSIRFAPSHIGLNELIEQVGDWLRQAKEVWNL
ncbi:MAG: hypothetical protein MI919_08795 [Holophagales bacterium]|nr:hypothetical protein [Holophagales bacterium]